MKAEFVPTAVTVSVIGVSALSARRLKMVSCGTRRHFGNLLYGARRPLPICPRYSRPGLFEPLLEPRKCGAPLGLHSPAQQPETQDAEP